jgi:hypothetical protein
LEFEMKKKLWVFAVLLLVCGIASFYPMGVTDTPDNHPTEGGPVMDLSQFSDAPPEEKLRVLFIHHSTGGQLLAEPGPENEDSANCIYETHPNGGGLRKALAEAGYEVHEASYNSEIGSDTDLFHWLPKFRDHMERVLATDLQDERYAGDEHNNIVMFKSCYPNSNFVGEGTSPGNPEGPELTYWNVRATLSALLEQFSAHPDTLFVYFTAPPLAPPKAEPLWKWLARKILRRPRKVTMGEAYVAAALARRLNNWVRAPDGWLHEYPHNNVIVFDYFDVLTDHGESNMLRYPTGGGYDSHPSTEGQRRAAAELVPLLNRAVRRAGLGQKRDEATATNSNATQPEQPQDAHASPDL